MPQYLLSGTDTAGRHQTELVDASSADEAASRFKARGFIAVTLHSDEATSQFFKTEVSADFFRYLTPQDYVAVDRLSRWRVLVWLVVWFYRRLWWLFAPVLALVVGRRVIDARWNVIDFAAVGILVLPPARVLYVVLFGWSARTARVMSLYSWGRWAEVLAALRQSGWRGLRYHLERSDSAPVVAFYEAKCLAGLGRLDEALATVRPYANNPDVPAWMYWCLLANVFDTVRLGDRVIECYEKALDIAPDNQNVLVDFAHFSLDYRRDTARARSLLTELRRYAISDDIRPFLVIVEGLLALEEGRPEQAREILSEAAQLAEAQRHTSPMRGVLIDRIHTYLTLTCAAVGDHAAAEEHFKIAEPRMRALNEVCWLERCQTALGHRT